MEDGDIERPLRLDRGERRQCLDGTSWPKARTLPSAFMGVRLALRLAGPVCVEERGRHGAVGGQVKQNMLGDPTV
jgi:hypothetical protein